MFRSWHMTSVFRISTAYDRNLSCAGHAFWTTTKILNVQKNKPVYRSVDGSMCVTHLRMDRAPSPNPVTDACATIFRSRHMTSVFRWSTAHDRNLSCTEKTKFCINRYTGCDITHGFSFLRLWGTIKNCSRSVTFVGIGFLDSFS